MNNLFDFSIFGFGEFSLITTHKIASRRLEGVTRKFNDGSINMFKFTCDFNGDDVKKWKYFTNDIEINYELVRDKLKNVKYFLIRNPYERCFSGFIQHFHVHYLMNEVKTKENYSTFWTHNPTADFDFDKDTTVNLDILFNPFPSRDKSNSLQKEFFEERESSLKDWLVEWNRWFVDNIEFAVKNNMLEDYLLSDTHHSPYLVFYKKLLDSDFFREKNIKFIKMENIDAFLGIESEITDSLGIFKKVNDTEFKKFYEVSRIYQEDEKIWESFIKNTI